MIVDIQLYNSIYTFHANDLQIPMIGDWIQYDFNAYKVVERIFNYDNKTITLKVKR